MLFILKAIIIAIVEGITEFLPVSSTGHMILAGGVIGFPETEFTKMFNVVIQLGAILAIVVLYWSKLWGLVVSFFKGEKKGVNFVIALIVGVIPAAILGFLLEDTIDQYLFKPVPVIIGLFVGAVLLLYVEGRYRKSAKVHEVENITKLQALKIGFFQCLAMWPGMSRSSSTIMGGWITGLDSKVASEYSFFLAIPVMVGASLVKVVKFQGDVGFQTLGSTEIVSFALGFLVAFLVALICVKGFVSYIQKKPMKVFAYYRIALSIVFTILILTKTITV
ncbi:undecaprenyl-diphosphate phosphatase [Proteiniclasticum sp. BAD-10]|uniref:Undecaprenyl-diphosphatase n=1 Tax=Proteiniclasticum sediminis TaxID=2804028 RepID=A0A941HQM9_9CLOT|nr:undecaprenyl-diphosphate phosphatase [Proteiniclasticum sediminis]